jgi:hypothetical protein
MKKSYSFRKIIFGSTLILVNAFVANLNQMTMLGANSRRWTVGILALAFTLIFTTVSGGAWGQTQIITQTGNGTYTVPAGATAILVECWGAGGGVAQPGNGNSFGGGGGGAYAAKTITGVSPNQQFLYTIGNGVAGLAGQDTYFGNSTAGNPSGAQVLAKGGFAATSGTNGASGGQSSSCIGDVAWSGGNGANRVSTSSGGGGGGAAGTTNIGSNGSGNTGGSAGPDYPFTTPNTGSGGNGAGSAGDGADGISYGGGAGASARSGGTGNSSRVGAQGVIRITVITSPPTISSFTPSPLCSAGGQTVSITGTNFSGTSAVTFNGVAASSFSVTNATTISAVTPANVTAGVITVTTPAGSANSSAYTVTTTPGAVSVSGGGTVCGSATLVASGGSGGTIYWQNTTNNGTSTATASSNETVNMNGTYYFRAENNGCWGPQGSATVTITSAPSITSQPVNQSVTTQQTATFSVTANGTNIAHQWQEWSGSVWVNLSNGGVFSGVNTSTLSITNPPLTMDGRTYRCLVTGACSPSAISDAASLTVTLNYCSPTFTSGVEPISNVQFNSINNSSDNTCNSGSSLEDFTSVSTSVVAGTQYTISVTGNTCGNYTNHFRVYFDWNQNGSFTDTGESYYMGTIVNTTAGTQTLNITIPASAQLGATRMRVMKRFSGDPIDPCQTGTGYGQAEDYTINIIAPSCFTPSNLSVQDITSTSATISWDAASPAPANGYEYFVSSSSSAPTAGTTPTGTTAAGVTSANLTLTPNSQYYVWVRSNCGASDKSSWVGSLYFSNQCATKYWAGAGSGMTGGTTSTDFNNSANWSTTTGTKTATSTPGPCDDVVVSFVASGSCIVTNNITIKSLSVSASNNISPRFGLGQNVTFTVNENTTIQNSTGGNNWLDITVHNGSLFVFNGDLTTSSTGNAIFFFQGWGATNATTTGKYRFNGNVTLGTVTVTLSSALCGGVEFDGTGTQNYVHNTNSTLTMSSSAGEVKVGVNNSPTVIFSGSGATNPTASGLTISPNATLDLGTRTLNRTASGGGLLSLGSGSTLKLSGTTGGQTGSNFPTNFTTYTLDPTSTVEYYGGTQTVFATPTYGNLTISTSGTKTPGAGLTVAGNMLINSPATFAASSFTHSIGGNLTSFGTFTPGTSTIRMSGAATQNFIEMASASKTFYNLTIDKQGGEEVQINSDIDVTNNLTFVNKNLRLNENVVNLGTSGQLVGENDNSHAYCDCPSAYIRREATIGANESVDPGNLGLQITTNGNQMGETVIKRKHYRAGSIAAPLAGNTPGVYRIYDVAPEFNGADYSGNLNVDLVFNYLSGEIGNDIAQQESQFEIWRTEDSGNSWEQKGGSVDVVNKTVSLTGFQQFSGVTVGPSQGVLLPVKLTSFEASCNDAGYVTVSWQTESESNSSHFIVERSRDGDTWLAGSPIPAAGYSNALKSYSYADMKAGAYFEGYYRLRQIDFDGEEEVFGPVSVSCEDFDAPVMEVYPNPTKGNFAVRIFSNQAEEHALIMICNANGQTVHQQHAQVKDGATTLFFDQGNLEKGVYFIRVVSDHVKLAPQKLIIH